MTINRFILILFALSGLLSACAVNPVTDNPKPSEVSKQQGSNIGAEKHLELKAFLNQHGTVSLHIDNHSAFKIDDIFVVLRLRYSARIVSNIGFAVGQDIKAGQSLLVDTEIPLPTARSIIRAKVMKAKIAP
ncbi:MAG: hypothetical protein QNK31_07975 [Porticoccus sp.]|nr:hypothetical protein [Porticoccus sp.]